MTSATHAPPLQGSFGQPPAEPGMCLLVALVAGLEDGEFEAANGVLQQLGFEAHRAGDGLEAMQMASDYGVDLIVCAIAMPRMDGIELMGLVQRGVFGLPAPPMVVCAGEDDIRLFWETASEGTFAAAVRRPVDAREFADALAELLPLE